MEGAFKLGLIPAAGRQGSKGRETGRQESRAGKSMKCDMDSMFNFFTHVNSKQDY
jgi:hypothetical protein